ncbi:hypothetical protein BUE80_DR002637 [Diplocarpon rosae]|nr:hypothetical protein BUE80_DR002637 [Diplocarpon rosae]
MDSRQSSLLPNELWIRILENLNADEDLPTLWKSCRQVSTAFKAITESIFREKHLPRTRLGFYLGEYVEVGNALQDDEIRHLAAGFEFSSLCGDRATAIFSADEDLPENLQPRIKKRLREYLVRADILVPQHTVQIRRDINDGPIPNLSIEYEKLELSCDWRKLFSIFYNEEFLYRAITAKTLKEREPLLAELKAEVDRGQMDPRVVMQQSLTMFGEDLKTSRKLARRARIIWQCKEHDGTEWDFDRDGNAEEENKCLADLEKIRYYASFEEFSDEESDDDPKHKGEDDDDKDS